MNYIFNLERTKEYIEITRCQNLGILVTDLDYDVFKENFADLDILP